MPAEVEQASRPLHEVESGKGFSLIDKLDIHPIREKLYNELHNRAFHLLSSPAQLTHIAIQHEGELLDEEHAFISQLCERFQVNSPAKTMPCFYQSFGLFNLRWKRHMEYSTYTFIREAPLTQSPFIKNAIDYVPTDWLENMPGQVVAACHLVVESKESEAKNSKCQTNETTPDEAEQNIDHYFDKMQLIASAPINGLAKVWTSFKLHDDSFGRFLVYENGLSTAQLGRLIQRLLELDTYRLMATLGLPLAQEINAELTQLDMQLKEVTTQIASQEATSLDRESLAQVSAMAAKVEDFRAQSNYRFAATNAYYDVVLQRMEELKEHEISGHLTLREFLTRRLTPAVKTCKTISMRLEDISRRITRASDLLRTRVEIALQEQNQQLLVSMDRRAHVQMRLQQTVEGLSVAAISYYSIQLLEILLDSLTAMNVDFNKEVVIGMTVPVVIGVVFIGTRFIHKRLMKGFHRS